MVAPVDGRRAAAIAAAAAALYVERCQHTITNGAPFALPLLQVQVSAMLNKIGKQWKLASECCLCRSCWLSCPPCPGTLVPKLTCPYLVPSAVLANGNKVAPYQSVRLGTNVVVEVGAWWRVG